MSRSFAEVGLPAGHAFPELAYHPAARSVIVLTCPPRDELPYRRLSIRGIAEREYRPPVSLAEDQSVSSFVCNNTSSRIFFITTLVRKVETSHGAAYSSEWDALHRYDISIRKHEVIARRGELHVAAGHSSAWLNDRLGISDDGSACM